MAQQDILKSLWELKFASISIWIFVNGIKHMETSRLHSNKNNQLVSKSIWDIELIHIKSTR